MTDKRLHFKYDTHTRGFWVDSDKARLWPAGSLIDYVLASDYDALAAELAEMKSQARHWQCASAASSDRIRELEAAHRRIYEAVGLDVNAAHFRQIAMMALGIGSSVETGVCTCARITQPDQHFPGCPQFGVPQFDRGEKR
ncbi:MAG TPA: hypothetical protein VNU68_07100 [Verrucomicrobiae bacterium]|nr:hypothetical protein [Verrucomicrobiae bacterium]